MSFSGETTFHCPSCDSAIDFVEGQNLATCEVCLNKFPLAGHLCPNCGVFHKEDDGLCTECGSAMVHICRNCHSINWPGFDTCMACGEATGLASSVVARSTETTADRLDKQMENARKLKLAEEDSSNKRMAEMMAIEEARQAEIRKRIIRQKEQEKRLLMIVLGSVAVFLLVLVVYAIYSGLS